MKYRQKHVELIEVINEIIIVASSWLFILLLFIMPLYKYLYVTEHYSKTVQDNTGYFCA